MLGMFTAAEAAATAYLITEKDYSLYQHIEIRILDTVRLGGTYIFYAGEMNDHVLAALKVLGYQVLTFDYEDERVYRISWELKK